MLGHVLERSLATAEDEARALPGEIEAGAEVDRERHVVAHASGLGREPHVTPLAVHRDLDPGHGPDLAGPGPRGAHGRVRRARPARGAHARNAAGPVLDPDCGTPLQYARAARPGRRRVALEDRLGAHVAVARAERR